MAETSRPTDGLVHRDTEPQTQFAAVVDSSLAEAVTYFAEISEYEGSLSAYDEVIRNGVFERVELLKLLQNGCHTGLSNIALRSLIESEMRVTEEKLGFLASLVGGAGLVEDVQDSPVNTADEITASIRVEKDRLGLLTGLEILLDEEADTTELEKSEPIPEYEETSYPAVVFASFPGVDQRIVDQISRVGNPERHVVKLRRPILSDGKPDFDTAPVVVLEELPGQYRD